MDPGCIGLRRWRLIGLIIGWLVFALNFVAFISLIVLMNKNSVGTALELLYTITFCLIIFSVNLSWLYGLQIYKPGFMLVSLVCYGTEAVICIIVLFYMRVRVLYLTITSVAFVCLFILAVLSYTFVKQSISHIPESLTTERLTTPMYDVSNGPYFETIMIKTIA